MKEKIKKLIVLEGGDFLVFGVAVFAFSTLIEKILDACYIECDLSILKIIAIVFGILGFICEIYSLINAIKCIKDNKKWSQTEKKKKIALSIILNIYYLPIFYTRHIYTDKNRKWWGILDTVLYAIFTFSTILIFLFNAFLVNIIIPNGQANYIVDDRKLSLVLNENFECFDGEKDDGFSFYCSNILSEETIMAFNYSNSELSKEEIFDFHINQEKEISEGSIVSEKNENGNEIFEIESRGVKLYRIISFKELGEKASYIIEYAYQYENNFDEIISNISNN